MSRSMRRMAPIRKMKNKTRTRSILKKPGSSVSTRVWNTPTTSKAATACVPSAKTDPRPSGTKAQVKSPGTPGLFRSVARVRPQAAPGTELAYPHFPDARFALIQATKPRPLCEGLPAPIGGHPIGARCTPPQNQPANHQPPQPATGVGAGLARDRLFCGSGLRPRLAATPIGARATPHENQQPTALVNFRKPETGNRRSKDFP